MPVTEALTLREVTREDCQLLWEWANEPGVRLASFETEPIAWDVHQAWFRAKFADPQTCIFIACDAQGGPIGQIRFDLKPTGYAEIDLSVSPASRGKGYGARIAQLGCEELTRRGVSAELRAHCKPDNQASIEAFRRAGFTRAGTTDIRGSDTVLLTRLINR